MRPWNGETVRVRRAAILPALILISIGRPLHAQSPSAPIHITVGFGVDTAGSPFHEIFSLWRTYLLSRPDSIRPTTLWSETEQQRWPHFDVVGSFVYQGFPNYTVVQLVPAVGLDSAYVIRTLVTRVSDSARTVRPLALYRVYAVREQGRWVLANALPRLTRNWRHETIGRIRFVFPPSLSFDRARAGKTSAYVDSLARAFDVDPPPAIDYYFTGDLGDTYWAAGIEFFPTGADTVGGRTLVPDNIVLIGSSSNGEGYRHEVSHAVLQRLVGVNTARLVAEGLMTWTGGSSGLDFRTRMPALNAYLRNHPDLTLAGILSDPPQRQGLLDVGYDGLAVLCEMVHAAGGVPAIRELLNAGREPAEVVATAARLLGVPPAELDRRWRERVARLAS